MMSALMYLKPDDHIAFMQECLNRAKKPEDFTWRTFVAGMTDAETKSKNIECLIEHRSIASNSR